MILAFSGAIIMHIFADMLTPKSIAPLQLFGMFTKPWRIPFFSRYVSKYLHYIEPIIEIVSYVIAFNIISAWITKGGF